ncbi:putative amidophosphoribosyltransferase [Synechococcus sp. PCC 7502]|uniref:ComF family protein n=1 Tax=Synechococcus sp. PCC 7502 TaxID=1173263 RepID=UPI00029FC6D1|nr:ComF family protein [Synechococcus sp. PCC 7502]AFY74956.1 putative amidophosphoribosyltransferase [Synechococcus sp. PCC 7502]
MQSFLNLFLKPNCPLCGRSAHNVICIDCDRQISACKSRNFYQNQKSEINLFAWGVYDGSLKQAIATCKFENHPELSIPLGIKIGELWNQDLIAQNLIKEVQIKIGIKRANLKVVPIPMHPEKLKSRGFNQAELLAKSFCQMTEIAIAPQILQRVKNTKAQIDTKSIQERQDNLNAAFRVDSKFKNQSISVILFDDIYTTGATINEAIATLKSANIKVIAVVVLATPRFKEIPSKRFS